MVFFGMRRPGKKPVKLAVQNFWTEPPAKKGGKPRRMMAEYPQAYTKTDYKNLKKLLAAGKPSFVAHERRLKTLLRKPDGSTILFKGKEKGARGRPRYATKLDFGTPRGRGATSPVEVRPGKRWVRLDGFRQRDKHEKRQFRDLIVARQVGVKRFELDPIEIKGKTIKETISRVTFPFDVPYLKKHRIDLLTASGTVTVMPDGVRRSFSCTFKKRQDFATVVSREIRKALAIGAGSGKGGPGATAKGGFGYFFTALVDVADFAEAAKENLAIQIAKGKKNAVDADMAVDRYNRTVESLKRPGMKPLKALKKAERLLVSLGLTLHKRPEKRPPSGKAPKKPTRPTRRPAPKKPTRPTRRPAPKKPTRPTRRPAPKKPTRPTRRPAPKKPVKKVSRKIPQKKGKSHVVRKSVSRRVAGRSRHPVKAQVGRAHRKLARKRGKSKPLRTVKIQARKRVSDKRRL